jgi:chemotaxis protein methyltransferase CheR
MTTPGIERDFVLTSEDFSFLAALVYKETGIVLGANKQTMVYSRLSRRLRELKIPDFKTYCRTVTEDTTGVEMGNLVNAITTNLTSFFRENHHFEHLKSAVLEPLLKTAKTKRLRIWSAGCSQGCEPYSIAMVLADLLDKYRGWDAKILATDIDTNMIARGRSGEYRAEDYDSIPAAYRKYVSVKRGGDDKMLMSPVIKSLITFNPLNLLVEPWPMRGVFDVIFCRNVVIYFDKDTQKILFNRYAEQMKSQGWLYIGHSENLSGVCNRFKLNGKTIYQKAS